MQTKEELNKPKIVNLILLAQCHEIKPLNSKSFNLTIVHKGQTGTCKQLRDEVLRAELNISLSLILCE